MIEKSNGGEMSSDGAPAARYPISAFECDLGRVMSAGAMQPGQSRQHHVAHRRKNKTIYRKNHPYQKIILFVARLNQLYRYSF
jgi:hypothetical protein